jgi:hypothetical protein
LLREPLVRLFDQLKAGNATLLLVRGEHPEGELPKVWVHALRKAFCPDTGTPCEKRDVFDLADFARAAQQADANLERAQAEAAAWKEILGSVVKAKREGDFSKDLQDKDVKAAIEAAQNTVSR